MKVVNTLVNDKNNLKICLIADIHFCHNYKIKKFDKIITNIKKNNPNYICIVGDIIDTSDVDEDMDMKYLYNFITNLASITKVIIALGNHDISHYVTKKEITYRYPKKMVENFKKISNVIFLDNEQYIENDICFIGYTQGFNSNHHETGFEKEVALEVSNITKNLKDTNYNILLSHNPLYVGRHEVYSCIKNFNLINIVLSGHTHNGLLPTFIKTNKVLISPMKNFFVSNARGHFKIANADVIVNGGIIKFSKTSGFFRFFNFLYPMNIDYVNILDDNNKNA
ncbi:MAG: metallophosphoesterase [Bacilli bacterium]|nr:metallophosphoesterase [Bacilli bacterium]